MQLGRQAPDGLHGQFRQAVIVAEAEAESRTITAITTVGMNGDPKLLCWYLERRWPQRWGRQRAELAELRRMLRDVEAKMDEVERLTAELEAEKARLGVTEPPDTAA